MKSNEIELCDNYIHANGLTRKDTVLFLAAVTMFWFAQYVYIPYQTAYLTGIGTASGMIGIIVGAYGISQMLFRLPVGISADKVGKHKIFILLGTLSSGFASVIRMLIENAAGFLLANLFSGLASAMWISFMVYFTGKGNAEERQRATARIILFNNVGILTAYMVSTLIYANVGMKNICLLSVLAGGFAFLLAAFIKEQDAVPGNLKVSRLLEVCMNKRLILFAMTALILQGVGAATTTSFTNQLLAQMGASNVTLGVSSIINMISTVLFAAVASAGFCNRRGPAFWVPKLLLVMFAYCIFVPIAGNIPLILVLQILPGITSGILFSLTTSEAMLEVPAEKKSTAMGFFQAVYAVGMSIFPIFTGKIAETGNVIAAYWTLAGIVLAGCFMMLVYYRTRERQKK